jgi:hypothetical protein
MIRQAVLGQPGAALEASIRLWQELAVHLTAIIGEAGFDSLYARSLHRASIKHPWLDHQAALPRGGAFTRLRASLHARGMPEAGEASVDLLNVFVDTLTILIGDQVSSGLLRDAWGDHVVDGVDTETPR